MTDDDTDDPFRDAAPRKPDPDPRYSVRPEVVRPWTVLEDLVVWVVLAPRESDAEYRDACGWLCATLNRVPTAGDLRQRCVTQIEHRTVTRNMEYETPEHVRRALELYGGCRAGLPLSWAERHGVLLKYHNKPANGRARVPLETVITLTGRNDADDGDLVRDYLHVLEMGWDDPHELSNPIPDPDRAARLAQRCARDPVPSVWAEFVRACRGEGNHARNFV